MFVEKRFVHLFKKHWHLTEKNSTRVEVGLRGGEDTPLSIIDIRSEFDLRW
jgi:hypothetical protein